MKHLTEIVTDLIKNGFSYNFFVAIYWLEKLAEHQKIPTKILYIPTSELTFPAADITNIETSNDGSKLYLNFMGLYGVDSPLPHYFFVKLALANESNEKIKKFLNIFNQRIYQLLYAAWKKYRVYVQLENNPTVYLHYLIALSGNTLNYSDQEEFAFAGILGARNHNSASFGTMLREYLNTAMITITEFIPIWMKLDQELVLGSATILGNNSLLGNCIVDLTSKVLITIGPMFNHLISKMLPGEQQGQKLVNFMQRYLGPLIDFDLKFINHVPENFSLRLGYDKINLGWNFLIGASKTNIFNFKINRRIYY